MGGHAAGGGFGLVPRKFGLAADNVLDAVLIGPDGSSATRATMDGDVFWAIVLGCDGGSWAVVYFPSRPSPRERDRVQRVARTGPPELVAGLMHRCQHVGPSLPDEFYLSTFIPRRSSSRTVTSPCRSARCSAASSTR